MRRPDIKGFAYSTFQMFFLNLTVLFFSAKYCPHMINANTFKIFAFIFSFALSRTHLEILFVYGCKKLSKLTVIAQQDRLDCIWFSAIQPQLNSVETMDLVK